MSISQIKIDAFAAIELAITQLRDAYRVEEIEPNKDGYIESWLLVTAEMTVYLDCDENKPDDDLEMKQVIGAYSKRGQLPMMGQALAQEYLEYCRRLNA